jgi:transcriptional regulator with XRE-family HTH domain
MRTARRSPTVRRRRLGGELRQLREAADLTIERVAEVLGFSDSKISRIETGQVSATPRDVRRMLELYGVSDEQQRSLLEKAREAQQKDWWQAYSDTLVVPLVGLEAEAASIRTYEPLLVPGLFQTEAYARAVIGVLRPDLGPDRIDHWVELRMARQSHFKNDPPQLSAVLDEAALRRPVGGRRVMGQQLHHLVEVLELPTVHLQVLPYEAGEHAGMTGGFTIFSFHESAIPDTLYIEQTKDDLYSENAQEVQRYVQAFASLRAVSLTPDASLEFLALLSKEV